MVNTIREIKVSYKNPVSISASTKITKVSEAVEILRKIWDDNIDFCESLYLLCLNRSNRVLGWVKLSQGGLCNTIMDIRHIYAVALKTNACNILIAHNHPSGSTIPSENDKEITKLIKEAGRFLEVNLIDHIILTREAHYSFADEGLL